MKTLGISLAHHQTESDIFTRRLRAILFLVIALFVLLFANLAHLQISCYRLYRTRSRENRIRLIPIAPSRGLIYDRNGILLAGNRPAYSLVIYPQKTKLLHAEVQRLQHLLGLSDEEARHFFAQVKNQPGFKSATLADDLTMQQVARFSVRQFEYAGASIQSRLERYYPYGGLLTHVLGYVAKINDTDREHLKATGQLTNYAANRDIGKLGIEKYYEKLLHGHVGYQEVEVNNVGRVVRTISRKPSTPGHDIYLNIDLRLQIKAQEELGGRRGAVIVMDPKTGAILAMASSPSYNPNSFVDGISEKKYSALIHNKNNPLINRATQGVYAPASTVKPLMTIMGLDSALITPATRYFGRGYFQIPGSRRKFYDWEPWGHGWMTVYKAIEQSADTFFYHLAYLAGIKRIHQYMHLFGFGQYTGVDIDEERTGNLPSSQWKQARYHQPWYLGDTISVGIGQGYWSATPMQLAHAFSILIDHGKRVVPQILKGTVTAQGFRSDPSHFLAPFKLKDRKDWQVPLKGMYMVIQGKTGTGHRAFAHLAYQAGGKSGTAQLVSRKTDHKAHKVTQERHKDNALFVAFAPFKKPKFLVVSIIENAGDGHSPAANIARAMLDTAMSEPLNTSKVDSTNGGS
ncbi:penicillin-binding protein 2 [Dongshaea marina]|uniref:penicillin-binding protein 2 n=1 Tax=Dongshaea marina TaxID=2047966 RepID=UPI000D3EA4EC|nr:penicillin-binding protein 2 [Dongshaea marina]